MKRRQLLQAMGGALVGTGLWLPRSSQAQVSATPLAIPEAHAGEVVNGVRRFDLRLAPGTRRFLPGVATPTLGINGDFLGPTLRMTRGETVEPHVHNALGEPTTVHWHGLHVPVAADGGPHQVIATGETWTPRFEILQRGGTFWYHSHLLDYTGEQVYRGLAGMILIDDEQTRHPDLPQTYGVDDIPLIIQDRRFNDDGSFRYVMAHSDIMTGLFGDTILINGTVSPYFEPTTQRVRFRVLNGSNARTYTLAFDDDRAFDVIATDGGLLQAPVSVRRLEMAPAERFELVVDFSDGRPVTLVSLPMAANSPNQPLGMMARMHPMNAQGFDLLQIRPQAGLEARSAPPSTLTTVATLDPAHARVERRLVLSMAMGMGMGRGAQGGGGMGRGGMGGMGGMGQSFFINGQAMDMGRIDQHVFRGDTEIWEIFNDSMMMHPFHIHHGQFQVLSRNGQPPGLLERGEKDTVKVGPGEAVRFIMRFDNFSDAERPYMYHCHILEHEDNGMMGQFIVT